MNFVKISVTGNDFIVIDDRLETFKENSLFLKKICTRRLGVGADGVIILRNSKKYDFSMTYFNSDGSYAAMCGNGGRAIIKFANFLGIKKNEYLFEVGNQIYKGGFDKGNVYLIMNEVTDLKKIDEEKYYLNTGVPHLVVFDKFDLEEAKKLRNTYDANVNYVMTNPVFVRTYERGVEDETLSCGTGVVASAYCYHKFKNEGDQVVVNTRGGKLYVEISSLKLTSEVNLVYKGELFC